MLIYIVLSCICFPAAEKYSDVFCLFGHIYNNGNNII